MKKKTFFMIILIVALTAMAVLMVIGAKKAVNYGFLEGRVLAADNGSYLIILDDHSPIRMSDRTKKGGAFLDLQTGDKIRIFHNGVRLSYPGQTDVYHLRLLARGSAEDIPADVLDSLRQMGWIRDSQE
jgi:hypothetical protein